MLFTREYDYSLRILRALSSTDDKMTVQEISKRENITVKIAYKLAGKLESSGLIRSYRGAKGGYALNVDVNKITLYDVATAVDRDLLITECLAEGYCCSQNHANNPCKVNKEFCRIQRILMEQMKLNSLAKILSEP